MFVPPEPKIKGILQTRFGAPEGNCYAACVATVMSMSLASVPDVRWPPDVPWYGLTDTPTPEQQAASDHVKGQWREWLSGFNLTVIRLEINPQYWTFDESHVTIGTVTNKRGIPHAVVCMGGKPAWDPNPLQDSYDLPVTDHEFFVALKPSKSAHQRSE